MNNFKNIFSKTYFILKIKRNNVLTNYIIVKNKHYNKMRNLNNDFIKVLSFSTFMSYITNDNFLMKKHFFSTDIKCLYGKNVYISLHNYALLMDDYEDNLKKLYNIIKIYNNNKQLIFYLTIFYQLLNGIHFFETINNLDEMNKYIIENNLTDINNNSFKQELFDLYNKYY